jgi:hypothetical protein
LLAKSTNNQYSHFIVSYLFADYKVKEVSGFLFEEVDAEILLMDCGNNISSPSIQPFSCGITI